METQVGLQSWTVYWLHNNTPSATVALQEYVALKFCEGFMAHKLHLGQFYTNHFN